MIYTRSEKLKTYLLVTVVTILVWLYLENENIRRYDNVPLDIVLTPATPQLIVSATKASPVLVSVRCSTNQYEQLKALAASGPLKIELREDAASPEQTLVLLDKLNSLRSLSDLGVIVEDVRPMTLSARVERLVERSVPVVINSGDLQLQAAPTIEPAKVSLTLPASLAEGLGDLTLAAPLASLPNASSFEVNEPYLLAVPVALPESLRRPGVKVEPASVKVGFTIRKLTKETVVPRVTIVIEAPLVKLADYTIKLDENDLFIRDVRLTGPNDLIDRIDRGEIPITAVLRLTAAELDSDLTSKLLEFNKPEQVKVASPVPQVKFTIVKRAQP